MAQPASRQAISASDTGFGDFTMCSDWAHADGVEAVEVRVPRGVRHFVVALLGAVVAAMVVAIPRNNSVAAAVVAAVLSFIVVLFLDWGMFHVTRLPVGRLIIGGAIGGGIGYSMQLTDAMAFERAFGRDVPAGVAEVHVAGHYIGRFADHAMLIQCRSDAAALEQLLGAREFSRDVEREEWWQKESVSVWRELFGGYAHYGGAAWDHVDLPARVQVYRWSGREELESTVVLWDVDAGRLFVLYILG